MDISAGTLGRIADALDLTLALTPRADAGGPEGPVDGTQPDPRPLSSGRSVTRSRCERLVPRPLLGPTTGPMPALDVPGWPPNPNTIVKTLHYSVAMDVSFPASAIIPSLDGPVLIALANRTSPTRLSDVHRSCGAGSLSGVSKVLRRLVAAGVVTEVPGGYLLNRDHLAAPAVELLANLRTELTDRIRRFLTDRGNINSAALVGSTARRDGGPDSDIDVVVVADDPDDGLRDALEALITAWTGNPAHVIVLSPQGWSQVQPATRHAWRTEAVDLIGSL